MNEKQEQKDDRRKRMTNEELIKEYRSGTDVGERLYTQNIGFVRKIAVDTARAFGCLKVNSKHKLTSHSRDIIEELAQEGFLTFLEKLDFYNCVADVKLTTYLHPYIKGVMYRWLENHNKIPVIDIMPGSDDENNIWNQIENIADTTSPSVEEQAEQHFDSETLKAAFDSLSAKEKFIIGHTYGLFGYEKYTVDDIALVEMMTPGGVRKAEKRATERLKKHLFT